MTFYKKKTSFLYSFCQLLTRPPSKRFHSVKASNVFRPQDAWKIWERNKHWSLTWWLSRDIAVFEKLPSFQKVSVHTKTQSQRSQIPPVLNSSVVMRTNPKREAKRNKKKTLKFYDMQMNGPVSSPTSQLNHLSRSRYIFYENDTISFFAFRARTKGFNYFVNISY